jgi:type III secretion protein S
MQSVDLLGKALYLAVLLSLPVLIVSTVVGVGMSLIQALFQMQDQTPSVLLKIITTAFTLALCARWMSGEVIGLSLQVFDLLGSIGR